MTAISAFVNWVPGQNIEDLMAKYEFKWHVEEVDISSFDLPASVALNTRCGGSVLANAVDEYCTKMIAGSPFLMIVAHKSGRKYRILDGIQRIHAAIKAGCKTVRAYILTVFDDESARSFARVANTLNGTPPTAEEIAVNAMAQYHSDSKSLDAVAGQFGMCGSTLGAHIARERVRRMLSSYAWWPTKTDGYETSLGRLDAFSDQKPVLVAAAKILFKYKLSIVECDNIIAKLKACNSERQRLNYLEEWERTQVDSATAAAEEAAADSGKPRLTPSQANRKRFDAMLANVIRTTDKFEAHTTLTAVGYDNIGARKSASDRILVAISRLASYLPDGTVTIMSECEAECES